MEERGSNLCKDDLEFPTLWPLPSKYWDYSIAAPIYAILRMAPKAWSIPKLRASNVPTELQLQYHKDSFTERTYKAVSF